MSGRTVPTAEHDDEVHIAALLRAWDAAPDATSDCPLGRILRGLTEALEAEGLAEEGRISKKGKALLRRVDKSAKGSS